MNRRQAIALLCSAPVAAQQVPEGMYNSVVQFQDSGPLASAAKVSINMHGEVVLSPGVSPEDAIKLVWKSCKEVMDADQQRIRDLEYMVFKQQEVIDSMKSTGDLYRKDGIALA